MDEQQLRQQVMGLRIAMQRDTLGLSQRQLAQQVGVAPAAVANWESGGGVPRWPVLRALASALGVSSAWIVQPLVEDWRAVQTREDS